jgi:hypothetical protein
VVRQVSPGSTSKNLPVKDRVANPEYLDTDPDPTDVPVLFTEISSCFNEFFQQKDAESKQRGDMYVDMLIG